MILWDSFVTRWRKIQRWRDRLERIPGKWKDEVAALRGAYPDRASLQAILDSRSAEAELHQAAAAANLDAKRLIAFLGASLQQSAEPLTRGWLSRHTADILLLASLAVLAMLPFLGSKMDARQKAARDAEAIRMAKTPHAIATRTLVPYVNIEPADVEPKNAASDKAAEALRAGLVGRYPLKPIAAGRIVTLNLVSGPQIDLGSSELLRITLKLKPALEGRTLPSPVSLLFSSRGTQASGEVFSIVLLALDADGLTATIALPQTSMSNAAKWMGNSDAYVSFPVGR
jgi:hypothetical protein